MALTFIRGLIHICMIVILKKLVEQPDAVLEQKQLAAK